MFEFNWLLIFSFSAAFRASSSISLSLSSFISACACWIMLFLAAQYACSPCNSFTLSWSSSSSWSFACSRIADFSSSPFISIWRILSAPWTLRLSILFASIFASASALSSALLASAASSFLSLAASFNSAFSFIFSANALASAPVAPACWAWYK